MVRQSYGRGRINIFGGGGGGLKYAKGEIDKALR